MKISIGKAVLALLIGIIFLSSYLSYVSLKDSVSPPTATSSSNNTTVPQTVFGFGYANATLTGYNNTANITISCKSPGESQLVLNRVNQIIVSLEANNSVANSYTYNNNILIQAGNSAIPSIYMSVRSELNESAISCFFFSAQGQIELPPEVQFYIESKTYELPIPASMASYQVPINLSSVNATGIPVKVAALLTVNGTIYSINVTRTSASPATPPVKSNSTNASTTATATNQTTSNMTIGKSSSTTSHSTQSQNSTAQSNQTEAPGSNSVG